jgi:hypothetical protein
MSLLTLANAYILASMFLFGVAFGMTLALSIVHYIFERTPSETPIDPE